MFLLYHIHMDLVWLNSISLFNIYIYRRLYLDIVRFSMTIVYLSTQFPS